MIEGIPPYISISFIVTTFAAIGLLFFAIKQSVPESAAAKIVAVGISFWLFFTAILSLGGFYLDTAGFPPRVVSAPFTALLFILLLFVFFRNSLVGRLPLKLLTLVHIVRIPVEIVLWWLYRNGQIPEIMTFQGLNFDILAGLSAPLIYLLAFRKQQVNTTLLIGWNIICLMLLINIVVIAIFSLPTEFQKFGLSQPNKAVLHFPYIWLPAIVVPIVLFAHLSSLYQLFRKDNS